MSITSPFDLWAKTGETDEAWHALPFHLVDVACCGEALWTTLPEGVRRHVSEWLGPSETSPASTLAFLAGCHDIGKANPFFQAKAREHRDRLKGWDLCFTEESRPHGQATGALLKSWLEKREPKLDPIIRSSIAAAAGGHHGTFFTDFKLNTLGLNCRWLSVSEKLLDSLEELYPVHLENLDESSLKPFVGWLAGFVSISDWIGSSKHMVTYETRPRCLLKYRDEARTRAEKVLKTIGFLTSESRGQLKVQDLVPAGTKPNQMQKLAADLSSSNPRLTIIEAPTGEGKTEAALILAEQAQAEGRGLFLALPTMATANGIIDRIDGYLRNVYKDHSKSARLLHGGAWLVERGAKISDPDDAEGSPIAEDWFAGGKRALLDPIGVGTVDQLLLAALNVKHFFVRLFGLAGKTIIIDEVHAYDVYMTSILEVLLSWLKALDCQVILLSATLPSKKRNQILEAWGVANAKQCDYPRITTVTEGGVSAYQFEVRLRKELKILPLRVPEECQLCSAVGQLLQMASESSGFGVLIVNTVNRAQEAYKHALEHPLANRVETSLFHARYTRVDRGNKETSVLREFGKHAARGTPRLLIATQVVEQSLDLDFDYMITELAPIDLLIQRAGRLHRHPRSCKGALLKNQDEDERPGAELLVLISDGQVECPHSPKSSVYARAVLAATEDWLGKGRSISKPSEVEEAIESVYGRLILRNQEEETDPLHEFIEQLEVTASKAGEQASLVVIQKPTAEDPITFYTNELSEEEDAHHPALAARTRLEDLPSIDLVIWPNDRPLPEAPFTLSIKRELFLNSVRVSVPHYLLKELMNLKTPESWRTVRQLRGARVALTTGGVFETPSYLFRYSYDLGLSWEKRDA